MNIIYEAQNALSTQINGINELYPIFDENFAKIVEIIAKCNGHIILCGVGKRGNIGMKIVATMSSIGIPAFFLDPFNAGHGDMGMITKNDAIISLSNSGESSEIMSVLNYAKENGNVTISITREAKSTLATNADFSIVVPKSAEAHDFMAPTTSTTQMLIIGDIIAVCASKIKNFAKVQYAKLHPSGNLGMKISKITTIMNSEIATVESDFDIMQVLDAMSKNSNGFCCVTQNKKTIGIITDGDIRRFILKHNGKIENSKAIEICNKNPKLLHDDSYIIDAINVMEESRISSVIVVDTNSQPIGFVARNQFNI
jgi:arabinose-5-phosphate isomerase